MDVGIIGLANSGRTTVLRALLAHRASKAGGRSNSNIGTIHVQDPRLEKLSSLFNPKKTTPVEILVHDLCSSQEGGFNSGEVSAMKRMDILLGVLPGFTEPSPDAAVSQLERLLGELYLQDLAQIEGRLARHPREKLEATELEALQSARDILETERPVRSAELTQPQRMALRGYALLTERPVIIVRNTAEDEAGAETPSELNSCGEMHSVRVLSLCASLEAEMADLAPEERYDFLAEYSVQEPAGAAVTRAILEEADVIPFFTVGEDECRAWPIARGTEARGAAGKIHTDIERGFIRAEVIGFEQLVPLAGLWSEARKNGLLRLEGKNYVIQDGEVVHFRFNV